MDDEQRSADDFKLLKEFIQETTERLSLRSSLLERNLGVAGKWPDDAFFAKKDSSLKKNTAFVKKVRNFLDSQKENILAEFEVLNLSKYVEELATAIVEAKIKITDIPFILKLCSAMHQRYADFSCHFLDAWKKVFASYKDIKHANLSKLRVDLALFADLNTIGVFREAEGMRLLASQLTALTNGDMENFTHIGIICSFCRHCSDDWIGLIPRRIRMLSSEFGLEIPRSTFMPAERQAKCRGLFHDYLAGARIHLQTMVKEARRIVAGNRDQLENRGEVSEERQDRADQLVTSCRKFHESLTTLADLLDSDPPPDFASMIKEDLKASCSDSAEPDQEESGVSSQLFEDEDTRLFYESLPDIRAMVPGILYKESEQTKPDAGREKHDDSDGTGPEDIDLETVESELAKEEARCKAVDEAAMNSTGGSHSAERDKPPNSLTIEDTEEDPSSSGKILMETFLTQLPNCINRDLIDRAAIDFCLNLNKRSNRRRLARALLMVPRTRYDLLPFYARLVAALAPVMPDLVADVNTMLTGEFRWRVSKRDQLNLESKLKIVRFIGELVKFRIFPTHQALGLLKQLLPQFVHHNIEMACALLDTCGRFLYRLPTSHKRTKVYLEVMLRKKTALHMDQRYTIMIENTYYYCNPPPSTRHVAESVHLTPTMQYLRRLLWRDLDRSTVNSVLRSIRKMDWDDTELVNFAEVLFTRAWELRYTNINCLASVLSGLAVFHSNFATAVVDNVIEDIRVGMELNLSQLNQRRISMVKYLGLLYNYCLVDSPVIFKMLYSLLTFGVSLDNNFVSLLDPPDSLFRITLICTLLETSGGFFDLGKKRRKLNIFLIYFQRYYWFKRSQPIWVQLEDLKTKTMPEKDHVSAEKGVSEDDQNELDAQNTPESDQKQDSSVHPLEMQSPPMNPITEGPLDGLAFTPFPFPAAVEQFYAETLAQLRFTSGRAKNLAQAERLVKRLEARYLPRLVRLKATYGLMGETSETSDGQIVNGQSEQNGAVPHSARPTGPGHMDTIAEEAEPGEDIPLDEDDYAMDEDEDDEDDDDEEDEERGTRSAHADRADLDGNRRHSRTKVDSMCADTPVQAEEQEASKQATTSDEDQPDAVESEEERLIRLGLKPRYIECPEDVEFREALDRMMAEALLLTGPPGSAPAAGAGSVSSPAEPGAGGIRIPTGSVLPSPDTIQVVATRVRSSTTTSVKPSAQQPAHTAALLSAFQPKSDEENCQPLQPTLDSTHPQTTENQQKTVPFSLITRRGNRPHLVSLAVPETVQFAARYMQAEAAEREEKARMKQLVLEMHEAQKEEEMEWGHLGSQDAVLAHQFPVNVNRDRWVRYNHPKGAPDADAVFGTSSQRR
ncbi:hypothetical protein CRM22_005760 [Opisthorchis felineus]|uniref:MIF4G domain-containing protein n=1 Tax=Opisthorchis felineus TaxID=147828 RepID=A0A4S2LPJ1_OPIFE|nr:hypothetical protein CRM22_005760 [Opisthorchis felineus]